MIFSGVKTMKMMGMCMRGMRMFWHGNNSGLLS